MNTARLRPPWLTFRRFAGFTTVLTMTLIMLGVYTAATGSGLACSAQWPLCDNGLLPQTVPSFIEWFHRLIAMITGFFILGTTAWAWRRSSNRTTRLAATAALVLLPLQVSLGAVTVTLNGYLPGGYSPPTQAAHLVTALAIFTSLVLTSLFASDGAYARAPLRRAYSALVASLVVLPVATAFGRVVGLIAYTPASQAAFFGVSLTLFATLVAATLWLRETPLRRLQYVTGAALALVFATMVLGRDLIYYTPAVRTANAVLVVLVAALIAVATWVTYRRDRGRTSRRGVTSN
ncbi:MAG: COX15/CtaA family protein [Salinigranum sp.]